MNGKSLLKLMDDNLSKLQQGLDEHRCFMASMLEENLDDQKLKKIMNSCPSKNRESKLRQGIEHAISVLEESRKSFKSKRLEGLRKDLTKLLGEV